MLNDTIEAVPNYKRPGTLNEAFALVLQRWGTKNEPNILESKTVVCHETDSDAYLHEGLHSEDGMGF